MKVNVVFNYQLSIKKKKLIMVLKDNSFKTNFNLYNKILDYSNYVRINIFSSIPAVHRDLRIHLADESFNLAKIMFCAVYTKGNIRVKHLIDMQVTISTLDMLSTQIISFNCAPKAKVVSSLKKLEEIKNITYAWVNNEEKKKQ